MQNKIKVRHILIHNKKRFSQKFNHQRVCCFYLCSCTGLEIIRRPYRNISKQLRLYSKDGHFLGHLVYDVFDESRVSYIEHFPESPMCHVSFLEIWPQFQRQGYGTHLLNELISLYPNFYITLDSVTSAVSFYERLGFVHRRVKWNFNKPMIRKPS